MNNKATTAVRVLVSLLFAMLVLYSPHSASAQEARGTIKGTVMDSGQAAVPGATVKITNVAMGTSVTVPTNSCRAISRRHFSFPERIRLKSRTRVSRSMSATTSSSE